MQHQKPIMYQNSRLWKAFVIEGEATFVSQIEISVVAPEGYSKVCTIATEGIWNNYRTWKHSISKLKAGTYKIFVRSLDNKAKDNNTITFISNLS